MEYRHKDFKNPYGDEWWTTSCQHQYNLGESFEAGYSYALEHILSLLEEKAPSSVVIDILSGYECKR